MKNLIFFLSVVCFMWACENERKPKESTFFDEKNIVKNQPNEKIFKYGVKMQAIFQTDSGLMRNVFFGENLEKIQEKIELRDSLALVIRLQEGKNQVLNCKISFNIYEDADLIFVAGIQDSKLKEIRLATYLNTQATSDSLQLEMSSYFNDKYGNIRKKLAKKTIWQNDTLKIEIEDVGIPESPGLQMRMTKL